MNLLQGPGTYNEERIFVLKSLERIEEENKALPLFSERLSKAERDLNEAHNRIRATMRENGRLKDHVTRLEMRAGYIAAGCGATVALLMELGKWLLHR